MFTVEELNKAKELAYENWEKEEETEIGFEFHGQWITNPFVDESGRFEFVNFEAMCKHFGKENVIALISRLLESGSKQTCRYVIRTRI